MVDDTKPGEKNLFVGVNLTMQKTNRNTTSFCLEKTTVLRIDNDDIMRIMTPPVPLKIGGKIIRSEKSTELNSID